MNCKMRDSKAMKACFAVFSELKTQAFYFHIEDNKKEENYEQRKQI